MAPSALLSSRPAKGRKSPPSRLPPPLRLDSEGDLVTPADASGDDSLDAAARSLDEIGAIDARIRRHRP